MPVRHGRSRDVGIIGDVRGGISGLGIGQAAGWGRIVADTGAGRYGLYL